MKVQTQSGEFTNLTRKIERLEEENAELLVKLGDSSPKVSDLNTKLATVTQELEDMTRKHDLLKIDFEHANKELQVVVDEKAKLLEQNAVLRAQTDERSSEFEDKQRKSIIQLKEAQTLREQMTTQVCINIMDMYKKQIKK